MSCSKCGWFHRVGCSGGGSSSDEATETSSRRSGEARAFVGVATMGTSRGTSLPLAIQMHKFALPVSSRRLKHTLGGANFVPNSCQGLVPVKLSISLSGRPFM